MPNVFKVVETFVLSDDATAEDLAAAIQISADIPFSLHWKAGLDDEPFKMVQLKRKPEQAVEEELEAEPESNSDAADQRWDQPRSSQSWWSSGSKDANWNSAAWSGGKPCHVCGQPRHAHPDKKFCDVKASKRARQ